MNKVALSLILIYILINAAFTVYATVISRKGDAEKHMVSGGTSGMWVIAFSVLGVAIAGGGTMSVCTDAYSRGAAALWTNWGSVCAFTVFLIITIPAYKVLKNKFGMITSSGLFEVRFDKKCALLNTAVCILFFILCVALQPTATASVLCPLTGWDRTAVIIISGVFFTIITVLGGMKGVIWIAVANAVIMVGSLLYVCIAGINDIGGMAAVASALPEGFMNPLSPGIWKILENLLSMVFGCCFLSNQAQVALTAKSDRGLKTGWILALLMIFVLAFINVGIGLVAKAYDPDMAASSSIMTYASAVSPVFAGLIGCGVMGAIFSSAPASIMAASTHYTEDVYKKYIKPDASDAERLKVSRLSCLVMGLGSIALAFISSSMISLFYAAMQVIAPTGIAMMLGLFWKKVPANAAFWSICVGTPLAMVWFLLGSPLGLAPFTPSAAATLIILVVGTLLSKEKEAPGYTRYMKAKKELAAESAK